MPYNPRPIPTIDNIEDLRSWVEDEVAYIAQAFKELEDVNYMQFNILSKPSGIPPKIRDGMVVFVDSTTFPPPNNFSGLYQRVNGAWVRL